jgi:hypothetical protein
LAPARCESGRPEIARTALALDVSIEDFCHIRLAKTDELMGSGGSDAAARDLLLEASLHWILAVTER